MLTHLHMFPVVSQHHEELSSQDIWFCITGVYVVYKDKERRRSTSTVHCFHYNIISIQVYRDRKIQQTSLKPNRAIPPAYKIDDDSSECFSLLTSLLNLKWKFLLCNHCHLECFIVFIFFKTRLVGSFFPFSFSTLMIKATKSILLLSQCFSLVCFCRTFDTFKV